jgi:carbon-monoxide dehydrogenase medium subunit
VSPDSQYLILCYSYLSYLYTKAKKLNDATLVSIRDIKELRGVTEKDSHIRIGSLTSVAEIAASELIRELAPALWMAANAFADPTTRNSATIGGNIACSSPAADTAPPLLALSAEVILAKKGGQRRVALDHFFTGVNKNVMEPNELIEAFEFRALPKSGFYKLGLRNAMAISIATAAAGVELDGEGRFKAVRVAMGSVAPTPVRCVNAERALTGRRPERDAFDLLAAALDEDISPIDDIRASEAYRRSVAPVCVRRAIELALFGEFKCGGELI